MQSQCSPRRLCMLPIAAVSLATMLPIADVSHATNAVPDVRVCCLLLLYLFIDRYSPTCLLAFP